MRTHDVLKRFRGAHVGADQKAQFVDGLLDAALEQLVSFPYSARASLVGDLITLPCLPPCSRGSAVAISRRG